VPKTFVHLNHTTQPSSLEDVIEFCRSRSFTVYIIISHSLIYGTRKNEKPLAFTEGSNDVCGPGSSLGIAIGYGLEGPGIESQWGRDFPHLSGPAPGPTQPPVQWVPGFSRGVESGRALTLTPSRSKASTLPKGLRGLWKVETYRVTLICFSGNRHSVDRGSEHICTCDLGASI
jgi:hypothetical protein